MRQMKAVRDLRYDEIASEEERRYRSRQGFSTGKRRRVKLSDVADRAKKGDTPVVASIKTRVESMNAELVRAKEQGVATCDGYVAAEILSMLKDDDGRRLRLSIGAVAKVFDANMAVIEVFIRALEQEKLVKVVPIDANRKRSFAVMLP